MDIRELDRVAVLDTVDLVSAVTPADLDRPTPCSEWTVAGLLAHMTAQHRGFAAAARGRGADPSVWEERPLADPVASYAAAAREVLAAFAGDLDRPFTLPPISPSVAFPGTRAIGFHFIDYVVHGWDVARAVGRPFDLRPELAPTAVRIASAVPDGPTRSQPGAAFAPGLPEPDAASDLDRVLTLLGRSPAWPAT